MKLKTVLSTAMLAGVLLASNTASAVVFNDFTVDPDTNPGTLNSFVADKITGNYTETITFTSPTTFNIALQWDAGQFVANDGVNALPGALTGLGNTYGIYADFTGSGTVSTVAGITKFSLGSGGGLSVFLDATPLTPHAGGVLMATGVAVSGLGTLDPSLSTCLNGGINCGSFGQTTTFALNSVGSSFFVLPSPFYNLSFQSGQLNNFPLTGTQTINGSMDAVFGTVPEPTSIALLGLSLLGLGFVQRRKS